MELHWHLGLALSLGIRAISIGLGENWFWTLGSFSKQKEPNPTKSSLLWYNWPPLLVCYMWNSKILYLKNAKKKNIFVLLYFKGHNLCHTLAAGPQFTFKGKTWHVTCDTWHLTCDMFWGVNILSKFQLSSSYSLWFMLLWRSGGKGWLELMN